MKLKARIVLRSDTPPDREISFSHLSRTLEDLINRAIQSRFPEYDLELEVESIDAPDWPQEKFPKLDTKED